MVPGKDHDVLRLIAANHIKVLRHGIGRSAIPLFGRKALLRWQQIDKLIHLFVKDRPATLDMLSQSMGLILGNHANPSDTGVDAVGEGKVDNAEFAAEVHRRFSTFGR